MSAPLRLKAENLSCERGGRCVFQNLNFELTTGEFLDLRGANGAGKSSLLRLLAGLNSPSSGTVKFENGDQEKTLSEQSHYIGHVDAHKLSLTVRENLIFWARFLEGKITSESFTAFNLESLVNAQAQLLSTGQRRRLALSRLCVAERPLWLLDEPTIGLDAASLGQLQHHIRNHLNKGGMVIAATHSDIGITANHRLDLSEAA